MMQFIKKKWIVTFWMLLLPISVHAAVSQWNIIPNESSITFTGTQNNAPASGSFKKFTGDIAFDSNQLNASKVRIVVDMTSLTASYSTFTDTLLTADWFDVKKYPQAVFEATHFTKTGNNAYQANGTLTIRNKTLPVTVSFNTESLSNTNKKVRAKGSVMIKRLDYGVGQGQWADTSLVKNEVQVNFTITATKE